MLVATFFAVHCSLSFLADVYGLLNPSNGSCKKRFSGQTHRVLNTLDESGNIKFAYEVEQDGKLPFLDLLLVRTDNDGLKFLIYRKPTHIDQYLNFYTHHPIEHKLSVVRTLMERSQCMVSDVVDKKHKDAHVEDALRVCGYPEWSFDKVKSQMEQKKQKKKQKKQEQSSS